MVRTTRALFFIACCLIGAFAQKLGDCPPPTGVGICAITCSTDYQCQGEFKCCRTACGGSVCTPPITHRDPTAKPGICPAAASGPWVCSNRCTYDRDCRGKSKCCRNRCGALACTIPEY